MSLARCLVAREVLCIYDSYDDASSLLERLQKLKFRFRYHDGRLVDFQDFPFNFTLEFNMLKNEIGKCYSVRVPHLYNL